jgi:1-acyl-sn-glycerol-3-phosphate acyltransferase
VLVTIIIARLRIWASYLAMVCAGFVSFLFFRFPLNFTRVLGRNNIPFRGERVLFVSNHTTMYDSFLIAVAAYFPKHILYPSLPFMNFAARENFFCTWFSRSLFSLLRTVPVERRDHPWLMRKYVDFLERNNLLIFYQGTRSDDLSMIKNGPAFAIAHTQSPITVIPVYHHGIERIFSKGGPNTREPSQGAEMPSCWDCHHTFLQGRAWNCWNLYGSFTTTMNVPHIRTSGYRSGSWGA